MLYREESIIIHRKLPEVFNRAQDIASSLEEVSGYKKVEILKASGESISHRSTIRIFGIPVSYTSETVIRQNESIDHKQIKGPLPGLRTTWVFDGVDEDTRVTINHQLDLRIPVVGKWLEMFVYAMVISSLAKNCLITLKQNMEKTR